MGELGRGEQRRQTLLHPPAFPESLRACMESWAEASIVDKRYSLPPRSRKAWREPGLSGIFPCRGEPHSRRAFVTAQYSHVKIPDSRAFGIHVAPRDRGAASGNACMGELGRNQYCHQFLPRPRLTPQSYPRPANRLHTHPRPMRMRGRQPVATAGGAQVTGRRVKPGHAPVPIRGSPQRRRGTRRVDVIH